MYINSGVESDQQLYNGRILFKCVVQFKHSGFIELARMSFYYAYKKDRPSIWDMNAVACSRDRCHPYIIKLCEVKKKDTGNNRLMETKRFIELYQC